MSDDVRTPPVCPICDQTVCAVCLAKHFADSLRPDLRRLQHLQGTYRQLDLTSEYGALVRITFGALLQVSQMRSEVCDLHRLPAVVQA